MKFDWTQLSSERYLRAMIIVLIGLLIILIGWEWSALLESPLATPKVLPQEKQQTMVTQKDPTYDLVHSSLFGIYVSNDLKNIKESMLNITLVGILYANTLDKSLVIIRAANEQEEIYQLGDKIPGNAIIKKITKNGILVEHNGSLESISLPKEELPFEPQATPLIKE